ncbi:carboxypeptidase inhibitor SmCI-like isoform X2 [Patiria miniata]|uniref:BPTI/Kunitz inhibitor domain-containing protein n=1 Tax=Patiria miniata TaxID=46514 RepID=A0A913ZTS4_PATMI|nr:carboxypeptidase inhibitor SmCI-like isoform X2 [Patiria miniata]
MKVYAILTFLACAGCVFQSTIAAQNPGCLDPIITGPCMAYFPSFGYNQDTHSCESFIYGGCLGNANRFETMEACRNSCEDPGCLDPIITGPCMAYFPSFGYNQDTQSCESFIYGGCLGNANRFETMEACRNSCEDPGCLDPIITGPCMAYFPSFGYNQDTHSCESFIYGGCWGNGNRFETMEACRTSCEDSACLDPIITGPCMAYFPSFGYNQDTQSCERFIYGGCQGNGNRFETMEACRTSCED